MSANDEKKILLVAANPQDTSRLNLFKEFKKIEKGIEAAKNHDLFTIKQIGATSYNDLRRKLLQYQPHIVHFSGHGNDNGIILEDDHGHKQTAFTENLTELLQLTDRQQQLECIVLNACHSQTIDSDAKTLTRNEQHFTEQIFSQRNQGLGRQCRFQQACYDRSFLKSPLIHDHANFLIYS